MSIETPSMSKHKDVLFIQVQALSDYEQAFWASLIQCDDFSVYCKKIYISTYYSEFYAK